MKFSKLDKNNLDRALKILDPQKETIFGILGRMEVLLEVFHKHQELKNLIPFLQTYYLITKSVSEKPIDAPHYFKNIKEMEKLDIIFAHAYFKPLKIYLETGKAVKPWQTYFEYCENPNGGASMQMLLGINAHINGDLSAVISQINYNERHDFLQINRVLMEQMSVILSYLAFERHDLWCLSGVVFKKFFKKELHKIIVKWRSHAWKNAALLNEENITLNHIHNQTELVAEELLELYCLPHKVTRFFECVSRINSLKIK